jgi:hypothetical protein
MNEGKIGIVQDDKSPFQSPNTRLVASARGVGFDWAAKSPYINSFEEKPDGTVEQSTRWLINGDQKLEFLWATRDDEGRIEAHEEKISFGKFRERYTDLEWCRNNPDHPIAYMRASHRHHAKLLKAIHSMPRHEIIRNGKATASIPTDSTPEQRAELLRLLGR